MQQIAAESVPFDKLFLLLTDRLKAPQLKKKKGKPRYQLGIELGRGF
jgi:hypothetical protein